MARRSRSALQLVCDIRALSEEIDENIHSTEDMNKLQEIAHLQPLSLAVDVLTEIANKISEYKKQ